MNILIVDDDPGVRGLLQDFLAELGHDSTPVSSGEEALAEFELSEYDLLLLDLQMPGMDGFEVLRRIKVLNSDSEVVIITAFGSVATAIQALNMGAYAYINKPFDLQELIQLINRVQQLIDLRQAYKLLARERLRSFHMDNLVAVSPAMRTVKEEVVETCRGLSPVLLFGESGTGKRFLARIIHFNSSNHESLLLQLNSGEIENWLEKGILHHPNGVTISLSDFPQEMLRQGYGTLILNQVGELSRPLQIKLARELEERLPFCVPGDLHTGFRVIMLLEQPATQLIAADLIHPNLLAHFPNQISVPPLRNRPGCVEQVAHLFFQRHVAEKGGRGYYIAQPVVEFFRLYEWPGNLRELELVVNRLATICTSRLVSAQDLQSIRQEFTDDKKKSATPLESLLTQAEKQLIYDTFRKKRSAAETAISWK